MSVFGTVALAGAMAAAAAAGAVGSSVLGAAWRKRALRQQLVVAAREEGAGENGAPVVGSVASPARPSPAERVFQWMEVRSRALAMGAQRPLMPPALVGRREETRRLLVYADLGSRVSDQGFWDCSLLLGLGLALAGLCRMSNIQRDSLLARAFSTFPWAQTSSRTAISAASPRRGPSLVTRV